MISYPSMPMVADVVREKEIKKLAPILALVGRFGPKKNDLKLGITAKN